MVLIQLCGHFASCSLCCCQIVLHHLFLFCCALCGCLSCKRDNVSQETSWLNAVASEMSIELNQQKQNMITFIKVQIDAKLLLGVPNKLAT